MPCHLCFKLSRLYYLCEHPSLTYCILLIPVESSVAFYLQFFWVTAVRYVTVISSGLFSWHLRKETAGKSKVVSTSQHSTHFSSALLSCTCMPEWRSQLRGGGVDTVPYIVFLMDRHTSDFRLKQ
jgi:hypothetical protein